MVVLGKLTDPRFLFAYFRFLFFFLVFFSLIYMYFFFFFFFWFPGLIFFVLFFLYYFYLTFFFSIQFNSLFFSLLFVLLFPLFFLYHISPLFIVYQLVPLVQIFFMGSERYLIETDERCIMVFNCTRIVYLWRCKFFTSLHFISSTITRYRKTKIYIFTAECERIFHLMIEHSEIRLINMNVLFHPLLIVCRKF